MSRRDVEIPEELRRKIAEAVRERLDEVGRAAVEIAKETGSYHDVTGRLRASNTYSVDGMCLTIENTAPYAEEVESRGKVVITTAVLEAHKMLNEGKI